MTVSRDQQAEPMASTIRRAIGLAAMLVAIAGCAHRSKEVAAPSATPAADLPKPKAALNPTQRLARVVDLLNDNDEKTARVELDALLAEEPGRREALVLKQSIYGNPYLMVPRGSFSYIITPGDTFITIARDYLGDSYKFYALARISGIVPNKLKLGDAIQIPGRLREPIRTGATRARPSRAPARLRARPAATRAVAAATTAKSPNAPSEANLAAALRLRRQGLEWMTAGQINTAVDRLNRAQKLDPDNRALAADLARAKRIQGTMRKRR